MQKVKKFHDFRLAMEDMRSRTRRSADISAEEKNRRAYALLLEKIEKSQPPEIKKVLTKNLGSILRILGTKIPSSSFHDFVDKFRVVSDEEFARISNGRGVSLQFTREGDKTGFVLIPASTFNHPTDRREVLRHEFIHYQLKSIGVFNKEAGEIMAYALGYYEQFLKYSDTDNISRLQIERSRIVSANNPQYVQSTITGMYAAKQAAKLGPEKGKIFMQELFAHCLESKSIGKKQIYAIRKRVQEQHA